MKETAIDTASNYPEPSPELIEDIRKRLADVPKETLERAHHALMHEPIQTAGTILYKAGVCLCSAELYEYRKTLFPPNALVDPLTQDAPVLRNWSANTLSASKPTTDNPPLTTDDRSLITDNGLSPIASSIHPTIHSSADASATLNPQPSSLNSSAGATLLNDLRDLIQRYVVLPEMAAETLALWVVHTYAFTLRQVITYIGVVSPEKRCGKTTLLELLGRLANRSLTAANISPSAMFRVIEETHPTLLIDEADTFLEGRDELAGILNAGYRQGNAYVVRVADRKARKQDSPASESWEGERPREPEFGEWLPLITDNGLLPTNHRPGLAKYSCWCPKVMAAIGRLPDTLADRCILITILRKMPGEKCERMRHLNATELRRRCAQFVREHSDQIAHAQPEIPATLNDRAADIWEPLLAIADLAGADWPQPARTAAQKLSTQDDELTLIGYFLKDLRNFMVLQKVDRILSREIVAAFNPLHNRPWEDLRRGREINEWWLGWHLRELGIRPKYLRFPDGVARGYVLEDIEAAFRRYVPNAELHSVPAPSDSSSEISNMKS